MKVIVSFLLILSFLLQTKIVIAQTPFSFSSHWKARTYTPASSGTYKSLTSSSAPNATISVETATLVAPVLSTQFGVNTTFRNGSDQRTRSSLYNGITNTLRFPAGSGSNTYFWDGNIPTTFKQYHDQQDNIQSVTGINALAPANMTPSTFIQFKNDVNGEAIVVVNYFYARYGITTAGTRAARVQQAANYAAEFVRKLNIDLGAKVKYWEIGNEIYGKWEVGFKVADTNIGTVTGKEYGEDVRVFAQAMKAVDPSIKIGVVLEEEDAAWNAGVLPEVKDHADFMIVHEYFTTVNDATPANILASVPMIGTIMTTIRNCTGKPADYYPVALTEFNSRGAYNGSMINGVFVSQILGEIIKHGIGLSVLWVSEWNWDATTKDVKAFLAKNDPDQDDYTARPAYLPYYYYSKCFGDNMVQASSTNSSVKVYSSTFSSGEIGTVLINTTSTSKTAKLLFSKNGQAVPIDIVQWYEIYANTIEPTLSGYKKFYVNEQTSTTTGGGPDLNTVKPFQTTYSSNNVFTLPAYSVFFVIATKSTTITQNIIDKVQSPKSAIILENLYKIEDTNNLQYFQVYDFNGVKLLHSTKHEILSNELPSKWLILKKVYSDRVETVYLLNKTSFETQNK